MRSSVFFVLLLAGLWPIAAGDQRSEAREFFQKHGFNFTVEEEKGVNCTVACYLPSMQFDTSGMTGLTQQSSAEEIEMKIKEQVDKTCALGKTMQECLGKCDAKSVILEKVRELMNTNDFFCVEHYDEFVGYIPCVVKIAKTSNETTLKASCQAEDCDALVKKTAIGDKFGEIMMSAMGGGMPNKEQIKALFDAVCPVASCYGRCMNNVLKAACGADGEGLTVLMKDSMTRSSVAYASAVSILLPDLKDAFPADCFDRPAPATRFLRHVLRFYQE